MKKYPYTIISSKQFLLFYSSLVKLGYRPCFNVQIYMKSNKIQSSVVVLDDTGVFGFFCFYPDLSSLNPNIKRIFIKDSYRFLRCAAKYKNHLEF
jgi:hypothetical protein